jgi:hypothetical protein
MGAQNMNNKKIHSKSRQKSEQEGKEAGTGESITEMTTEMTTEMQPSVVRKIILEEHRLIREKLEAIHLLIENKHEQALKNAVDEFAHFFLKHLATEDKILRPVLATIDSWGAVRVEALNKEHLEQTQELKRLNSLIQGKALTEYESTLKSFVRAVLLDMAHEEKDFLNSDVLKDDIITAGSCS